MPTTGGAPNQFTYKPVSVGSPRWSSDGKWIYFSAVRTEHDKRRAVYRIYLHGGEAKLVASAPNGIGSFRISPDDK